MADLRRRASRSPLEVGEELLSVLMSSVHLCSGACRNQTEQYGTIYTEVRSTDEITSRNSEGKKPISCELMQFRRITRTRMTSLSLVSVNAADLGTEFPAMFDLIDYFQDTPPLIPNHPSF